MYETNNSKNSIKRPKQTGGHICKLYHKVLLFYIFKKFITEGHQANGKME